MNETKTDAAVPVSTLVYWCENDQWWVHLEDGARCPNDECTPSDNWHWDSDGLVTTRMRKRRMWVCPEVDCGTAIFGTKTYAMSYFRENHEHGESL